MDKNEACPGPVDCSSIKVVAKDYKGMLFGGGFGGGGIHDIPCRFSDPINALAVFVHPWVLSWHLTNLVVECAQGWNNRALPSTRELWPRFMHLG